MTQPQLDLLPDDVRDRCRAGLRAGRLIATAVGVVVLLAVAATHSRISLRSANAEYETSRAKADVVMATELRAKQLEELLAEAHDFIELQRQIAHPLELTAMIATIVNELPESMTIDRIDLDAGTRGAQRSGRSRQSATNEPAPPRMLVGEIAGFAASDDQIAELVRRMQDMPVFQSVSLDFSRTRAVRNRSAREFRVSFRVSFERTYVLDAKLASAPEGGGGGGQ